MNKPTSIPSIDARSASSFVDLENGLVDRQIFSDEAIYRRELERIFARAWNFMCHETHIKRPGDFFLTRIGEDQVIVTRDKKDEVHVLLNTCRHRGNTICRAEMGNTRSFMCPYHGWNYGLDGTLVGVPGYEEFYRGGLDREKWGLVKAAQVESYKGFIFATLDSDAPNLFDYLGETGRMGLDMAAKHENIEGLNGIQKNRIGCNWKMAVDNLFDWYHPAISHASSDRSGFFPLQDGLYPMNQMVKLGEYGHAIGGPYVKPENEASATDYEKTYGAQPVLAHPNVFPNLWVTLNGAQLSLRLPRGPHETEIWWFSFVDKGASEEDRRAAQQFMTHFFGPGGMLEQDDGENWAHSTRSTAGVVNRRYPLHFAMGKGKDEMVDTSTAGKRLETVVNEHGQLWTYQAWTEWMDAEDWTALKEHHSLPPTGKI